MAIPEGFTEVSDIPKGFTEVDDVPEGFSIVEDDEASLWESVKARAGEATGTIYQGAGYALGGLMAPFEALATGDVKLSTRLTDQGTQHKKELMKKYGIPEGKEESFLQKAGSTLLTLPAQLAAMPFQPTDTMSELQQAGESPGRVLAGGLTEAAGVVAGLGLPVTAGKGLLQKTAIGALAGGAQDYATRQTIANIAETEKAQKQFAPTVETTGLAAVTGGAFGAGVHAIGPKDTSVDSTKTPSGVDETRHVDLGQKEIVEKAKLENEKNIEYATYKIQELEKSLQDPRNAQRTPEQAEQFKTAVIEQIVNHQKEIQALKQANDNADAILEGRQPTPKPEGTAEVPSSLPPRPQVEGEGFVRPEKAPIPAEQARNADMFDQTVPREEIPSQVQPEMPLEQPRMDGEPLPEQIGTDVPTRVEETSGMRVEDMPTEEITIRPMEDTRPVSELDIDTVEDRIGEVRDGLRDASEFEPLIKRRAEIEGAEFQGPERQVIIKGGTKEERASFKAMLDEVGLGAEKIDVNLADGTLTRRGGFGEADTEGNVGKISVAPIKDFTKLVEESPKLRETLDALPAEQKPRFEKLVTSAHEIGHMLLYKLIQTDLYKTDLDTVVKAYDNWLKTQPKEVAAAGTLYLTGANKTDIAYYSQFPEFFAQRVARNLLLGEKAPVDSISKFITNFKKVYSTLRAKFDVSLRANNMVDDFINKIVSDNKASLEQVGRNIFEITSTKMSLDDAKVAHNIKFNYKTYEGLKGAGAPNMSNAFMHIRDAAAVLTEQQSVPDIAPVGTGTLFKGMRGLLNSGINTFTRNWFGIQQVAQIYSNSPVIRHTSEVILSSLAKQTQRSMELLAGVTDRTAWDAKRKGVFVSLQKVKDNLSLSVVAAKSSNADFYAVHQIFEQGIGRYSYEESLVRFGADLTPQQRTLFDTLSKMYGKMYKMAEGLEGELGKKKIIPNMKGWYPAVRKGEFAVSFHITGMDRIGGRLPTGEAIMTDLVYRQQFFSREEAQAFIEHFEKQSPEFKGKMQHNGIEEMGKTDLTDNMADFMRALEAAKEQLALEEGRGGDIAGARQRLQRLQDQYIVRGGTLGSHHKLRTNVPGAAGSEMFKDVGSAGQAFRDANFSSVDEYTRLMMKMEIGQKLDLLLNDEGLKGSHPETMTVVEQMRNYALNDVKSPLEMKGLKRAIDKLFTDTYTDKSYVRKFLGVEKYRDTHVTDVMLGKMSHLFYIHALMTRPAFWAAQGSQFMWIARSLVKDGAGPVDAMTAAGKGFMTVLKPDKDFLDGVFWQSQNTHTFSPQFINDLNKFHMIDFLQEGSKGKLLVDLVTGEKQSTAADTFSRLMSYSMMHEHYKALGYTGKELWVAAGKATDENMVQYGRQYKAPIFQKAGMVGDLVSPLQTFSQAALGNLVADVGQILRTPAGKGKLKAAMPFMMTMAITSLMAGVIGAPLVMEYEGLRLALNYLSEKMGFEARLPSVLDIVLSGDNDFSHRVLSHGLISSSTMAVTDEGLDIGASNRWQPIISGIITGEKTFLEAMPTINFALQEAGYMKDLSLHAIGAKDMSFAERRTAAMGITPGMYKGVTNLLYDRESGVVPTQKGDAFTKNTPTEKVAKFMGTSTISSGTERLRQRRFKEEEMRRQEKTDKKYELMADALEQGDNETVAELAKELATKYQQSPRQIKSRMKSEMFNRKVSAGMRQFVGKSGKMSNKQKLDYQRWMDTYEDNPFIEDEEYVNE